jgi:hypothetical protein
METDWWYLCSNIYLYVLLQFYLYTVIIHWGNCISSRVMGCEIRWPRFDSWHGIWNISLHHHAQDDSETHCIFVSLVVFWVMTVFHRKAGKHLHDHVTSQPTQLTPSNLKPYPYLKGTGGHWRSAELSHDHSLRSKVNGVLSLCPCFVMWCLDLI